MLSAAVDGGGLVGLEGVESFEGTVKARLIVVARCGVVSGGKGPGEEAMSSESTAVTMPTKCADKLRDKRDLWPWHSPHVSALARVAP